MCSLFASAPVEASPCLLFLGVPVLIFWWRTQCCGTVGISVNVTTVTTRWLYPTNGSCGSSFRISSWRSQSKSCFCLYVRCKGSVGRLLSLPLTTYFVCLTRIYAVFQPPNVGLYVKSERKKGVGPSHSWGMNVSIHCIGPCLSRCGTCIPENHKGMGSLIIL